MTEDEADRLLGLADGLTACLDRLGRYVRDEAVRHGVDAEEGPEVSAGYLGACLTVSHVLDVLEDGGADRKAVEALCSTLERMSLKTGFAIWEHTKKEDDE